MRTRRALSRYPFISNSAMLLALLAFSTSGPATASECYLMLYLGSDEYQVAAAGKTQKELEKAELPVLDADAPAYFVLLKSMTMSVVESAGQEKGGSQDMATSSSGSASGSVSASAAESTTMEKATESVTDTATETGSGDEEFRQFIPHEEIGLGYFCTDGSDEGESWYAPGGLIHALEKGNDLIIGLTKKGTRLPG